MPKVILVLLLLAHSKVYPLTIFVCKIEKSLPFYPYTNLWKKRTDILLRPLYNCYSLTQKIKVLADIGS